MLLSYYELKDVVHNEFITNVREDQINSSSIDLTLGSKILLEDAMLGLDYGDRTVILRERQPLKMTEISIEKDPFCLNPGQFILAQTEQVFNLPANISAEYKLKSSMARIGLEHLNAGWCDAGWHGSVLTLELKNMTARHPILLQKGDRIGQIVFFRHQAVPKDKSYAARGSYNNETSVVGAKKHGFDTET